MFLQCRESPVNQNASMNENDSLKRFVQNRDSFTRSLDGTLFYQKKKKFPFGTRKHFSDALHFYTGLKLYNVELLN